MNFGGWNEWDGLWYMKWIRERWVGKYKTARATDVFALLQKTIDGSTNLFWLRFRKAIIGFGKFFLCLCEMTQTCLLPATVVLLVVLSLCSWLQCEFANCKAVTGSFIKISIQFRTRLLSVTLVESLSLK